METNTHKLTDTLIYKLESTARIARIMAIRNFDKNKNISLSFNEFTIIDTIYTSPKIHQRDLAKILFKGTANLSRDLDKLEARGFIKRNIDTKKKRIVKTLTLTPLGIKAYKEVSTKVHSHISTIEDIYSKEEFELFTVFLERLKDRLCETEDMVFE